MATVTVLFKGQDALMAKLRKLADAKGGVKAGVLEGATNDQGTSVALYAAVHEFGAHGNPPRPFLRKTYEENSREWAQYLGKALMAGTEPSTALSYVGIRMQDDIIAKLNSNMPPPVSPAWRKYKEIHAPEVADKTLQYTGSLIHSIDYEVTP